MNITIPSGKMAYADYESKMMEAQNLFRRVVKAELQLLLDQNIPREIAVKNLLQRIVKCATEPTDVEVRKVMYTFKMNRDDAVRALIVKQELARLKQRGLDSFAAIEELTLKMQLLLPLSPMSQRETDDEAGKEEDKEQQVAAMTSVTAGDSTGVDAGAEDSKEGAVETPLVECTPSSRSKRKRKATSQSSSISCSSTPDVASAASENLTLDDAEQPPPSASTSEPDDAASWKEVSLCQRIGNCSISAASPVDAADAASASGSTTAVTKMKSRKRRPVVPEVENASRYGAKKKLRLDVDQKIKAQLQDGLVKMLPPSKTSKRVRAAKTEAVDAYNPKKHRSE
ncbi:Aste57867_25160 [Aphanomyces stellatus]|uniref:Aste57867_25160 protein n=1 Tax=Aphanomyces stellatus TaxID=120398 RepID=A0A485LTB4_9STRA|nr:hypothetical protein As57867_025082 [Aphanomyces stellatus]VFU01789.1 Aste57867_25160 [Aphanomyces stellatus]